MRTIASVTAAVIWRRCSTVRPAYYWIVMLGMGPSVYDVMVGHGLEAPVRVVRGALRLTEAEVGRPHLIEEEEGVDLVERTGRERPPHGEARALERADRIHDPGYRTDLDGGGHGRFLLGPRRSGGPMQSYACLVA